LIFKQVLLLEDFMFFPTLYCHLVGLIMHHVTIGFTHVVGGYEVEGGGSGRGGNRAKRE